MNENVTIPQSLWDKFIAPLFAREPEKVEVVKTVEPDDYAAVKQENEQFKAEIEKQKAETTRKARVEKFGADLKETKADPALAELLADLPDEKADAIMRQFRALSAQVNDGSLTTETGTDGGTAVVSDDPQAAFNAAVLALSQEKGIFYHVAFEQVKRDQPDLFKAAFKK